MKKKAFLWLQALVLKWGGVGMFAVTFVDSSSVAFPFFPDAVVMQLCVANPARMPYYVAMASLGSLAGAMVLFALAKKGGEAYFHRHARGKGERIKEWVEHNAFLSAFVPAILPPPFPFKPFVVAEGVFQVPLKTFVTALLLGRGAHRDWLHCHPVLHRHWISRGRRRVLFKWRNRLLYSGPVV